MANHAADRHILDGFRGFNTEGLTKKQIIKKFDEVCLPIKGTNPAFVFLCERKPEDASFYKALKIAAGSAGWTMPYNFFKKRYNFY